MASVNTYLFFCPTCNQHRPAKEIHYAIVSDEAWVITECCGVCDSGWVSGESLVGARLCNTAIYPAEFDRSRGHTLTEAKWIRERRIDVVNADIKTRDARRTDADITPSISAAMTPDRRAIASAEWSRQLREKVAATRTAECNKVLCDLQDEP